jgi:hypothetical protein
MIRDLLHLLDAIENKDRAKRASDEIAKFKRWSVYFPVTAWNDSFACVERRVRQLFEIFSMLRPDTVANSLQIQACPGSSTDSPGLLDDHTWSGRRNSDGRRSPTFQILVTGDGLMQDVIEPVPRAAPEPGQQGSLLL